MSDCFPLQTSDVAKSTLAVKWQQLNTKYEIHISVLRELDLSIIVPHCLDVVDKVIGVVGTAAHKGPSLYKVFPRTVTAPI